MFTSSNLPVSECDVFILTEYLVIIIIIIIIIIKL